MNDVFLIDDAHLDIAKGRYAVFDDSGELAAQSDDLEAAIAMARAKGARVPALVDLELSKDRVYAF